MKLLEKRWLPIWILLVVVLFPGHILPQTAPPGTDIGFDISLDKLLHLAIFAGLAALPTLFARRKLPYLMAVLIMAGGFEALQLFIPGRWGSLGDVLANLIGLTVGAALGFFSRSRWHGDRAAPRSIRSR
jgi:VanZ family protein